MSIHFYTDNEDIIKNESINNFSKMFKEYNYDVPSLNDALNEMFISAGCSSQRAYEFTENILSQCSNIVEFNFYLIKKKYPSISIKDAEIISSYTCETLNPYYSPYKILNKSLCEENREEGIKKVSKYLYIFLKALRELDIYYPIEKYMFRCINRKINLNEYSFKEKEIKYKQGNNKIFWGFTSISNKVNVKYFSKGIKKDLKEGTIFDLCGNIWGYDISLFNKHLEDEIILEPEQKSQIMNVVLPHNNNNFIHVRCSIEKSPLILKDIRPDYIKIKYKFDRNLEKIRIFGDKFVENNKFLKIIYEGNGYNLTSHLSVKGKKGEINIYLNGFNSITNLSHMFSGCNEVNYISIHNFLKYNNDNITNISYMFSDCSLLESLPDDISDWNISNITNLSSFFYNCNSLKTISDISRWNTSKVANMSNLFYGCTSLINLPDISRWNTSKVTNMSNLFYGCTSLINLPEISRWNTSKVTNMSNLFYGCSSLINLPDISRWNISNVTNISYIFYKCKSLLYLPDISRWKTSKVTNMNGVFYKCSSLSILPDISKWDISSVESINNIFNGCSSLSKIPDITIWRYYFENFKFTFILDGCISLSYLPDVLEWKESFLDFNDCFSLVNMNE